MTKVNQQLRLPSGRLLAYDEYGAPDGAPIFYFHGSPSGKLEYGLFGGEVLADRLNIRMIVPDRPGLGRSEFQPGRQIGDWPADVVALADQLALARFAVLGYSGGGPYAAACALKIPERLTRVGIVSGTAPFDEPGLSAGIDSTSLRFMQLARTKPRLSRLTLRLMAIMARFAPHQIVKGAMATLPVPDQAMLTHPEFQDRFIAMIRGALRAGPRGAQWDTALMVGPWDFRPYDVRSEVYLWHGEMDASAPIAMGRYMAAAIPNSHAFSYAGEGHLSLISNYLEEILNLLIA
ncbi:alpha/beta fold hydrolase [Tunturiibacter gelidiferens]|uniref:alpha/beta fold hydrolase n=1 Tax=Tunturiibacter gelidiferens TaxID=3069689 RepID=UPI003D9BC09C